MDPQQWPQEMGVVKSMEEMDSRSIIERRIRPQKEQALNCPRCNSTNTKFCYYNNYSLTQPRYFCKTCRRYWTEGGTLRNVPVGGGSRKNKRSVSKKQPTDLTTVPISDSTSASTNIQESQDLNLAFQTTQEYLNLPIENNNNNNNNNNPSCSISALDLLRNGFGSRSAVNPYMGIQDPTTYPSLGNGNMNVHSDGFSGFSGYGSFQEGGRVLFPFEDLRQVSSTDLDESKVQGDFGGYWSGMLGGGSWSQVPNYGP